MVHLRHGATHDVLACWFGVDCSATAPTRPRWTATAGPPGEATSLPRRRTVDHTKIALVIFRQLSEA
ncbi:hypothetical protein ABZ357_38430 [Streptomyces sp. NPDC005917]|uniref:hypothetical protein n=1 Tax=Streptomyces sp. NPDC005917 TaxID=3155347 RepID=UPI0034105BCD